MFICVMLYRKYQRLNVDHSNFKYYQFDISFQKSDKKAFIVDTVNVQQNSFKISSLKNDYPYLRDIHFPM